MRLTAARFKDQWEEVRRRWGLGAVDRVMVTLSPSRRRQRAGATGLRAAALFHRPAAAVAAT